MGNFKGKVTVHKTDEIFKEKWITVTLTDLEFETFNGKMLRSKWYSLNRKDVVAVLVYHTEFKNYLLVEQFRHSCLDYSGGWTTEVVAGVMEESDKSPYACAIRECEEEIGYRPKSLESRTNYMPSVGLSGQIVHSFYAEVSEEDRVSVGGGLLEENEDLKVKGYTMEECRKKIQDGEFFDSKTIIAFQEELIRKI